MTGYGHSVLNHPRAHPYAGAGSNRYRKPHPCPTCGAGPVSGRLYCEACRARRRDVYRDQAQTKRLAPGPNLMGCCGALNVVLTNPLRMSCCGMRLLRTEEVAHG